MTLNELIKEAASTKLNERNENGYTRSTFKIPGLHYTAPDRALRDSDPDEYKLQDNWNRFKWERDVKNWEAARKADLEAKGIELTDENKHLWNHAAAWNYINSQRQKGYESESAANYWNPLTWFNQKVDKRLTEAAPLDPVELEASKKWNAGYGNATRDSKETLSFLAAHAASKAPYFVPQALDYGVGLVNRGVNALGYGGWESGAARSLSEAKSTHDYKVMYANELASRGYTPDQIAKMTRYVGAGVWTPMLLEAAEDPNADPTKASTHLLGAYGNAANVFDNLTNNLAFRSSLLNFLYWGGGSAALPANSALAKIPGVTTGLKMVNVPSKAFASATGTGKIMNSAWGQLHPRSAKAVSGLINNGIAALWAGSDNLMNTLGIEVNPYVSMLTGTDYYKAQEDAMREAYGDQFTDAYTDEWIYHAKEGQRFVGEADWEHFLKANNLPLDGSANNAQTYKAYVNSRISHGAATPSLFITPMFQRLNPSDKVDAFTELIKRNYVANEGNVAMLGHLAESDANKLADYMRGSTSTRMRDLFSTFLATADADTITEMMNRFAGDGKGSGGDVPDMFIDILQDGLTHNMQYNPRNVAPMLEGMMKLQAHQAMMSKGNVNTAARAATAIKQSFSQVLSDPDLVADMPDKDVVKVAKLLAKTMNSREGMSELGDAGEEVAQKVKETLQTRITDIAMRDPSILNDVASLWFTSKGMTGMAGIADNPWAFWLTIGSLLLGGSYLISSGLDDDEEDDEESNYYAMKDAEFQRSMYG